MKNKITYSLLLAAASCGVALGQTTAYTTPVGYTTQTLAANTFNNVGLNLNNPTLAAGKLSAVSGALLSDSAVNFTTALPAGKTCILEITSGAAAGTVQEFVTWASNDITLPAAVTGTAAGDTYNVRVAPTLQEIFPVGLLGGGLGAGNADKVWVPNGVGGYTRYWYKTNAPIGWHTTTTGLNDTGLVTVDIPLIYVDGVLVEKKAVAKDLVISGEVKTTGSNALIIPGFNSIGISPPVGLTLFTSGLQGDIAGGLGASNSDIVWVPVGGGSYVKYWYKTNAPIGWHTTTTGLNDTGLVAVDPVLPPAIKIQRKGAVSKVITLNVPASYSSL
jgi:hypothetical protein